MIKIRERCSSPKTNYLSENNTFKGQQYFGILKTFTSFRQNYIHRRGEEGTHESWAMIKTPKNWVAGNRTKIGITRNSPNSK